jgi:hypothetical protein
MPWEGSLKRSTMFSRSSTCEQGVGHSGDHVSGKAVQ